MLSRLIIDWLDNIIVAEVTVAWCGQLFYITRVAQLMAHWWEPPCLTGIVVEVGEKRGMGKTGKIGGRGKACKARTVVDYIR